MFVLTSPQHEGSTQPKGTVVAQRPAAGQKLAKGSAVRLNVASGAAQAAQSTATQQKTTTTAPTTTAAGGGNGGNNYVGMRLQAAVQKITAGAQKVIVQYVASSKPVGVVVSKSHKGAGVPIPLSSLGARSRSTSSRHACLPTLRDRLPSARHTESSVP